MLARCAHSWTQECVSLQCQILQALAYCDTKMSDTCNTVDTLCSFLNSRIPSVSNLRTWSKLRHPYVRRNQQRIIVGIPFSQYGKGFFVIPVAKNRVLSLMKFSAKWNVLIEVISFCLNTECWEILLFFHSFLHRVVWLRTRTLQTNLFGNLQFNLFQEI
jgi:hypothetical protein